MKVAGRACGTRDVVSPRGLQQWAEGGTEGLVEIVYGGAWVGQQEDQYRTG